MRPVSVSLRQDVGPDHHRPWPGLCRSVYWASNAAPQARANEPESAVCQSVITDEPPLSTFSMSAMELPVDRSPFTVNTALPILTGSASGGTTPSCLPAAMNASPLPVHQTEAVFEALDCFMRSKAPTPRTATASARTNIGALLGVG